MKNLYQPLQPLDIIIECNDRFERAGEDEDVEVTIHLASDGAGMVYLEDGFDTELLITSHYGQVDLLHLLKPTDVLRLAEWLRQRADWLRNEGITADMTDDQVEAIITRKIEDMGLSAQ